MLNFFKKKSEADKLQQTYEKLMAQAHTLSKTNRAASDSKYAEAQAILDKIESISKR